MELLLNLFYLVFWLASLVLIGLSIKDYGRSSTGILFINLLVGTIILGLIRLLFFLVDEQVIMIEEVTLMVGWHLMFYLAIGSYLASLRALTNVAKVSEEKDSVVGATLLGVVILGLVGMLFFILPLMQPWLEANFEDSLWDKIGVLHMIAFVFAGLCAYYLNLLRVQIGGKLGTIAWPLIGAISILSLIHFWELITESWKLLKLGETSEVVESFLWIPVYLLLFYAFLRFRRTKL